jgi:hypothetical protein
MHREQPLRLHAVARLEHPDPIALGPLIAVEPIRGLVNGRGELIKGVLEESRSGRGQRFTGWRALLQPRIIAQPPPASLTGR